MPFECGRLAAWKVTSIAIIWFFSGVLLDMHFEGWRLIARKVALWALVRFLPGVYEGVRLQMNILNKWLVTLLATVLLDPTVDLLVMGKAAPTCKCIRTQVTTYFFAHLEVSTALFLSAELTVKNLFDYSAIIKHFPFHKCFIHETWHSIEFVDIFKILNLSIWMSIWLIFMIIMKQVRKSCANIKVNLCRRIYPCSPHMEPQEFLTYASLFIMFDGFNSEDNFCFCSIFNLKDLFGKVQELFLSPKK